MSTASPPCTPTKRKPSPSSSLSHRLSTSDLDSSSASEAGPSTSTSVYSAHTTPRRKMSVVGYPDYALPPLPLIRNKELAREVFTHSGMVVGRRTTSLADAAGPIDGPAGGGDNQKLEHVGDSLIGTIVTLLLHDMYPGLRHGPATTLKGRLVSNETLAHLSRRYDLPARLIALQHDRPVLMGSEKTSADVFEAYVAGVFYDRLYPIPLASSPPAGLESLVKQELGVDFPARATPPTVNRSSLNGHGGPSPLSKGAALDALAAWLDPLFAPLAKYTLDQMAAEEEHLAQSASPAPAGAAAGAASPARTDSIVSGAMAMLNQHFIFKESGQPDYDYTSVDGGWRCDVTAVKLDGRVFRASAVRANKKLAATHAAYDICVQAGI